MDYTPDFEYPDLCSAEPESAQPRQRNHEMNLAWQLIANTNMSVFLTGKAGTGKTTFLRRLRELSPKRMVVLAPTGVAAINAQGQTIHSFFQLPFGPRVPGMTTAQSKKFNIRQEKKDLIRTLDLLVIDEISMVRCDLLDAVDAELRKYRDKYRPFGGVQLLLIGDLQQLAPVAKDKEWEMLKPFYPTPYFYSSEALRQTQYVTIELRHIYRQQDEKFINILAQIRNNCLTREALDTLNARCIPFIPPRDEDWIRLTTHNRMADDYNYNNLGLIDEPLQHFQAEITGNFPESSYPAEVDLKLKIGAQVMFIKNDPTGQQRYYNGKIGKVHDITSDGIHVVTPEDKKRVIVEPVEWENTKFKLNDKTKEIEETVDGIFKQYPLRLAWAITVHKSQGLTFDHAVLDINDSFAHGQAYVALSRCRSLEGMILTRPLSTHAIITDSAVNSFINTALSQSSKVPQQLPGLMHNYYLSILDELFDFAKLTENMRYLTRVVDEHLFKQQPDLLKLLKERLPQIDTELASVAMKFQGHYHRLAAKDSRPDRNEELQERLQAAFTYFNKKVREILEPVVEIVQIKIENKKIAQQYQNALEAFTLSYKLKAGIFKRLLDQTFTVKLYLEAKAKAALSGATKSKPKAKPKEANAPAASYMPWSEEDDAELISMMEARAKYPEMMERFGRSRGAIKSRLKKLNLI